MGASAANTSGGPDRLTLAAFGAASLIGGMNFVAVRFSNRELPPYFGAGARFAAAALILLIVLRVRRIPLPKGRDLAVALTYGILSFTVVYALAYWSLQPGKLSAGVAAVVFASTPLLTLLLVPLHGIEPVRLRGIIGAVTAIAGIAILANAPGDAAAPVIPLVALLVASLAAAEAGVLLKKYPPVNSMATNAAGMTLGAGLLLVLSFAAGEAWSLPEQSTTWIAVSYLAVLGSVGLFGLFLFALSRWTASAVAYMTAIFPVVAMIGGAVVAGEEITVNGVVGGAVVLVGLYIGALMRRTPGRPSAEPEPRKVSLPGQTGCG